MKTLDTPIAPDKSGSRLAILDIIVASRSNAFNTHAHHTVTDCLTPHFNPIPVQYAAGTSSHDIFARLQPILERHPRALLFGDVTTTDALARANVVVQQPLDCFDTLGAEAMANTFLLKDVDHTLYTADDCPDTTLKGLLFLLPKILAQRKKVRQCFIVSKQIMEHGKYRTQLIRHCLSLLSEDDEPDILAACRKLPSALDLEQKTAMQIRAGIKNLLDQMGITVDIVPDIGAIDFSKNDMVVIHDTHCPVPINVLDLPLPASNAIISAWRKDLLAPTDVAALDTEVRYILRKRIASYQERLFHRISHTG